MKRNLCVGTMACLLMLTSSGCSISLGNRAAPDQAGTTLGRELMDLKESRDRGVITDEEYEEQRQTLLHRQHR